MNSHLKHFPYGQFMNVLCGPLEVVHEQELADACKYPWYNQTLCAVNESVVRLGVVAGEYHWHKHDNDDEFFYVVEGHLSIDVEGRTTIELARRDAVVIPKGVMHRTRSSLRSVILMVETSKIDPIGI